MTLSSEHSEVKICPRCKGDGFEDSPPLRKCWTCRGTGHLPSEGTIKHRRARKSNPSAPKQSPEATGCQSGRGAS